MAEAKLTERAVKAARWLLREKVTIPTVEAWQAAASKAGLTGEALGAGLARALEEHGTMEAARQAWTAAVAKLRADRAKLKGEVAALRRERDGWTAAVRDAGIADVREVADTAAGEVRRAAGEFERLSADAAELRTDVDFAKALRAGDPAQWRRVQPERWEGILARLEQWSEASFTNAEVPMPDAVRKQAKDIQEYASLYGPARMPLRGLIDWLRAGLTTAGSEPMRTLLVARTGRNGRAAG